MKPKTLEIIESTCAYITFVSMMAIFAIGFFMVEGPMILKIFFTTSMVAFMAFITVHFYKAIKGVIL